MEKASVSVKIYNSTYALTTSASEEQVLKIAAEVDRRMQELAESKKLLQTDKIAIWTAQTGTAGKMRCFETGNAAAIRGSGAKNGGKMRCDGAGAAAKVRSSGAENTGKICCARARNAAEKCCAGRRAAKPAGQI